MALPEAEVRTADPDRLFDTLVDTYLSHHPDGDVALLVGLRGGAQAHEGQMRQTGDPYITTR